MKKKMTAEYLKEISGEVAIGCIDSACRSMMFAVLRYICGRNAKRRLLQNCEERRAEDEKIKGQLHDLVRHEVQSLFYRIILIYDLSDRMDF